MRLFTKLRAEQISTVAYPLPTVPVNPIYPAETQSSSAVAQANVERRDNEVNPQYQSGVQTNPQYPQTIRAADGSAKIQNQPRNAENDPKGQYPQPNQTNPAQPEAQQVVITTIHRESYQSLKSELLLSPKVAERQGPEGPIVGDWYVTDYDILTDKVIRKVYDNDTFLQYFKASLGG